MKRFLLLVAASIGCLSTLALAQQVFYPPPDLSVLQSMVAQQALVQQADVTLDSSGNGTWTFSPAFPAVPSVVHMPQMSDANNPVICNYVSVSVTATTVHCWRTNTLGLISGLFSGNITGAKVRLIARSLPTAP